ncbi:MAG TPA: apolipoprotein N-acyltransferase [Devosia sp.]|nr:apolipoprotein N-acyltransferase [Devosia sp.]
MTRLAEWTMLSHGWRRFLLLVVAGAVAALSIPPLFFLPALFVAFPFWVWALDGAERRTGLGRLFGPAFSIGFAFGWGYFTVAFHWLAAAFLLEGGLYLIPMPFAILALAALIALFWGLASALAHLCWSHGAWRIVTLAAFLAAAEYARGTVFSGFPFDLLGYALTANTEMMQLASVVGVYGLTALAALLAMAPALIWPADGRALAPRLVPFVLAVAVIAAMVAYGHVRLASTAVTPRTDMRVRMVQPMITEHSDWAAANPPDIVSRLIDLSSGKTGPNDPGLADKTQLVWPESVFPFFMSQYPEGLARIGRMLPATTTLLTGAPREPEGDPADGDADNPGYNSLLAINHDGEIIGSYDKSHLVPFGEYLPFAGFWKLFGIRQFVPGTNGWAPGDGKRLMTVEGTPAFIALICYEAIFSGDLGADPAQAQFLLNISNDEWFDGSIGPAQHAHHALLRAVETGLPLLRATNSGVTFAADPLGRITAQLAPGEPAVLDVVPANKIGATPFDHWGNWPFFLVVLLGIGSALVTRTRPPRRTG